jgi:hypothetical protein
MTDKLQPGDLAIVIKSMNNEAIGKIVECMHTDGIHPLFGLLWTVKGNGMRIEVAKGLFIPSEYGNFPEKWLRKIPNDPLPEDENELYYEDELENDLFI